MNKPASPKGFTLIELMIVVAIIGILATIAYPSYQDQVRKSRRASAMIAVEEVAQAQERNRSLNMAYTATLTDLTGISSVDLANNKTSDDHYTIAITADPVTTFTVTATAASDQVNDACETITLNHLGVKGFTLKEGKTADCWSQ